ncbi:hypothetical protein [Emticicia sp. C21]|uniref:hypothetical protein n=1 Tax=Emticicia sp. C21 TaxID=2302915 RepID=UPI000E34C1C2|nr:hypothetical protein [Emticicia sp. C21]RFS15236.1 hypothetical protein D0T08_17055 [Emticicia sp. C21]
MRNLILFILFLSPLRAIAQKDSVNISYSEEKVQSFEKTTLIDEYEKAFGNNRVVKSALRISLNGIPGINTADKAPYPIRNFIRGLNPTLHFEQKISGDKSLIASFSGNRAKEDIFWNADIGLEARWYYRMKERVEEGKQQPNITGKYLSLKVEANPFRYSNLFMPFADFGAGIFLFRATSTYSFNWGWQLGNNVNYGVSVGIKHGKKSVIDNNNFLVDGTLSGKTATTLFISSNAQAGLGLFLPLKKRTTSNSCDFLQCNYEVKQLFKVNLNNTLYLDRYFQNLNLDIAYERKIGRSPFSINSNVKSEFYNSFIHNPTGSKLDTVYTDMGIIRDIRTRPTFSKELQNYIAYNFEIAEQLRYYIGMKNRIVKGKTASNLNGLYIGVLGSYRFQKQWFSSIGSSSSLTNNYQTKELSGGVSIGYQLQTNRRSFLDISTNILQQRLTFPIEPPNPDTRTTTNSVINFSLKLGFAR